MTTADKKKITVGFVIQTFVDDGKGGNKCIEQEFVAGDQVDWEDHEGNPILAWDEYQPYHMVQPTDVLAMRKIEEWLRQARNERCPDCGGNDDVGCTDDCEVSAFLGVE